MAFYSKLKLVAAAAALIIAANQTAAAEEGWIIKSSAGTVEETANKLVSAAEQEGATVFARVDHAAGAESIGEKLNGMTMVMVGNPKIGTPIMQAAPRAGLDLPNRVLIWEENGRTRIGYLDPLELKKRYDVEGADPAFDTMAAALGKLTDAASN